MFVTIKIFDNQVLRFIQDGKTGSSERTMLHIIPEQEDWKKESSRHGIMLLSIPMINVSSRSMG